MKQPRMTIPTFLMAFLTAAVVAFSSLMCLVEAFQLPCNPVPLLAWSCGVAAVSAGAMWFRRTGLVSALAGVLLLALILWFRMQLLESLQGFLYAFSQQYILAYPGFPLHGLEGADPTAFLLLLSVPLAWLTAWVTGREGSTLLVILACMPILVPCLIIVDIAPVLWLILLTGVLLLLLLTQSVRERNPAEGSRLTWWLVLPTVILVAGITVLWPPAAYQRTSLSDTLLALAETKVSFRATETQTFSTANVPQWNASLQTVDLSQVGPRVITGQEVLQYRSSDTIFYLRGVSLGVYEDNTWSAVPQQEFIRQSFEENPQTPSPSAAQLLELQVNSREPMLYTTYFLHSLPENGEAVDDAYISNSGQLSFYQMFYGGESQSLAEYDAYVQDHYTQVPEDLRPELLEIASQSGLTGSSSPKEVAAYVHDSAVYDLDTPRVPSGEDFVLYFLQQSHRGYCIHFASATVMLLRALGTPARYVTGYAVSGPPDQWNSVTDESAHAWVEYYVNGTGWLPLDPTPSEDETAPGADADQTPGNSDSPDGTPEQTPEASTNDSDSTDEPEQTDEPEADTPPTQEDEPAGSSLDAPVMAAFSIPFGKWLWVLALPALAGLAVLRRQLLLRRRKDLCTRGHPNRRALTLWHWLSRLSKADGAALPEDLLCLAEKARFSQHTLSEAELTQLQAALDARIHALQAVSPVKRLWYRYGLVLF